MTDSLEAPTSDDELYLARGSEVTPARPLMTGDLISDVVVPGVSGAPGLVVIITHPCSMRADGVSLAEQLLVARVEGYQTVPFRGWQGHSKVMPLPGVLGGGGDEVAARYDKIGLVLSAEVSAAKRAACLSRTGINLLQQRLIWYLTRFVVPTYRLNEVSASILEEADLQEEWVMQMVEVGEDMDVASTRFHDWIRDTDSTGETRQAQLSDPQRVATIRRDLRREIVVRLGNRR